MSTRYFNCLPTMIGSLPHSNPDEACQLVERFLSDIPAWPQLPNRSPLEGMVLQFSQGFPGLVWEAITSTPYVYKDDNFEIKLEKLYQDYLENNFHEYAITEDYAQGLYAFLKRAHGSPLFIKGQITGPISFALGVHDEGQQSMASDDTLRDAAARLLKLKVEWQEYMLKRLSSDIIIFVDEPALSSFGSAFFPLPREEVERLISDVLSGIKGIKGIHCCGNTDWTLFLNLGIDILSFDAYHYAKLPGLYAGESKKFVQRGGAIAWGAIPSTEAELTGETTYSLMDRLSETMASLTDKDMPFRQIVSQSLITPSCGLTSLDYEASAEVLGRLGEISRLIRRRYA